MEAQGWVAELRATRRARHQGRPAGDDAPLLSAETVASIVHVMSSLYRAAMKEHPPVVLSNPFAELDLPAIEPRPVDFYEPDEAEQLFNAVEQLSGPGWRTFAELGMDVGLRLGELAGLHGHRVDWLRARIEVIDVMTRQGLRQWPTPTRTSPARGSRTSPCWNLASCPVAHVRTTDFSGSVFVCLCPSGPRTVACHFPDGSLRI